MVLVRSIVSLTVSNRLQVDIFFDIVPAVNVNTLHLPPVKVKKDGVVKTTQRA